MPIRTQRVSTVREWGGSFALTLKEELLDMHLAAGDEVLVILEEKSGKRRLVIEPIQKGKR